MEPIDRPRFASCLMAAAELYGRQVSEAVAPVWWDALRSWDIGAVEGAFRRHFASPDTGQFMPKPADIIRMLEGTGKDAALIAWAKVDRAVRSVGSYSSVTFDDALIQRVLLDMGGWISMGQKTEEEWPFVANEFRNRYHGYRALGVQPEYPPRLVGIVEADNGRKGIGHVEHVLIGDPIKAEAVFKCGTDRPAVGLVRFDSTRTLEHIQPQGSA